MENRETGVRTLVKVVAVTKRMCMYPYIILRHVTHAQECLINVLIKGIPPDCLTHLVGDYNIVFADGARIPDHLLSNISLV